MPPRHVRRCYAGLEALGHDLPLLLRRPGSPPFCPNKDINALGSSTLRISRMSARLVQADIRRDRVHARSGSRNRPKPKDVAAATLTDSWGCLPWRFTQRFGAFVFVEGRSRREAARVFRLSRDTIAKTPSTGPRPPCPSLPSPVLEVSHAGSLSCRQPKKSQACGGLRPRLDRGGD
jgi:hypothetical protein